MGQVTIFTFGGGQAATRIYLSSRQVARPPRDRLETRPPTRTTPRRRPTLSPLLPRASRGPSRGPGRPDPAELPPVTAAATGDSSPAPTFESHRRRVSAPARPPERPPAHPSGGCTGTLLPSRAAAHLAATEPRAQHPRSRNLDATTARRPLPTVPAAAAPAPCARLARPGGGAPAYLPPMLPAGAIRGGRSESPAHFLAPLDPQTFAATTTTTTPPTPPRCASSPCRRRGTRQMDERPTTD